MRFIELGQPPFFHHLIYVIIYIYVYPNSLEESHATIFDFDNMFRCINSDFWMLRRIERTPDAIDKHN